jgi:hypothetical protein
VLALAQRARREFCCCHFRGSSLLMTCLGDADSNCGGGWQGETTVMVIADEGAAWVWNHAAMFKHPCEIPGFGTSVEMPGSLRGCAVGKGPSKLASRSSR